MSQRHVINLSTAWEPPRDGSRAWVRRFGRPAGIETGDHVWLVHEGGRGGSLVLNGAPLVGSDRRHDVTAVLRARNELVLMPADGESIEAGVPCQASPTVLSHGRRPLDARHGQLYLEIEQGLS